MGTVVAPGTKVLAGTGEVPGIAGGAVGAPIVTGAGCVIVVDGMSGGRLMSPGPGKLVPASGATPVAHDEQPLEGTYPPETPVLQDEQPP
jgi:hypothetical protein